MEQCCISLDAIFRRLHKIATSDCQLLRICLSVRPHGTTLLSLDGKGKAVPLQAWTGLEGSSKLRFPDFVTTAQVYGKVVGLTHRPRLPLGNTPGNHFS